MSYSDILLLQSFPSLQIVHHYYQDHFIIKCKAIDLVQSNNIRIERWEFNRPPDDIRCIEIAKSIYKNRLELDTMIYANYNTISNTLEIIDGIHRYKSLLYIFNEKSIFTDTTWLFEKFILVNIRIDYTNGQLRDLFTNINKSIPVPELYVYNYQNDKISIIEDIVKEYQTNFINHFSGNSKCNSPNINRELFIKLLDYLYEKYCIKNNDDNKIINKNKLLTLLLDANAKIQTMVIDKHKYIKKYKITQNIISKCKLSGCWLFLFKYDILIEILEEL
jgi:hypothetical protein